MLLYVDDILLMCDSKVMIAAVKRALKQNFDMKDLGVAKKILGIRIRRDRKKKKIKQ